jgi:peptide/nickel transport system ATP-binding protein
MQPLLAVTDLRVYYHTPRGPVKAVDDVNLSLRAGERYGLIGESGSGKTTTALAIMRLIKPPGRIESGRVLLEDTNLLELSEDEMRKQRLDRIALITQGAMNSLNPVMRIRHQFIDGLQSHNTKLSKEEANTHVERLLERVGLEREVADMYAHQLSGGMKQRVCTAIAISLRPKVIIADEPTSALDVVVQRQVMVTLRKVQQELNATVLLIGHDMGLMAQFADRVGIMYAGKLMEEGYVHDIFARPQHPYSQLLIASLPSFDEKGDLRGISGFPPSLLDPPPGCVFHPRCPYVLPRCSSEVPFRHHIDPHHWAACHLLDTQEEVVQ